MPRHLFDVHPMLIGDLVRSSRFSIVSCWHPWRSSLRHSQHLEEVSNRRLLLTEKLTEAVYYWASEAAGEKYGKVCAWFAGWLNAFAWIFAIAGNTSICSGMIIQAYALSHDGFVAKNWHMFVCYLIISFGTCFIVMFGQRTLATISRIGSFLMIGDFFVVIIVCATMPGTRKNGPGYAPSALVWSEWDNRTGYSSQGFTFLAGMLNGAYSIGAIDCITHIAEEIPKYVICLLGLSC